MVVDQSISAQPRSSNNYDPSALEFQSKFASYARKLARLRDRGDDLGNNFLQYAKSQAHSPLTKKHLTEFSGLLGGVQDHMQARILRIESNVVSGFSKYGALCHVIKEEVEKGIHIREREHRYMEELHKMQVKMKGEGQVQLRQQKVDSAAGAASDARRAHGLLLTEADKFEQQKLEDMRRNLMNFCEIELTFHAKALKLHTQAYNVLKKLDMGDDMETFRREMQILQATSLVEPDPNLILEHEVVEGSPSCTSDSDASGSSCTDESVPDQTSFIAEKDDSPAFLKREKRSDTAPLLKREELPCFLRREKKLDTAPLLREDADNHVVPCLNHFAEFDKALWAKIT